MLGLSDRRAAIYQLVDGHHGLDLPLQQAGAEEHAMPFEVVADV